MMAQVVIAEGMSGCGLREDRPDEFEIHFSNVRGFVESNLTVRLPVEVAQLLAARINDKLAQGAN